MTQDSCSNPGEATRLRWISQTCGHAEDSGYTQWAMRRTDVNVGKNWVENKEANRLGGDKKG